MIALWPRVGLDCHAAQVCPEMLCEKSAASERTARYRWSYPELTKLACTVQPLGDYCTCYETISQETLLPDKAGFRPKPYVTSLMT